MRAATIAAPAGTWRTVIVLGAILAALVVWDHRLDQQERAQRATSARVGRLLADVDPLALSVREVRITLGQESPPLVYSPRLDRLWRCLTVLAAPIRMAELERVIQSAVEATGVVRTRDLAAASRFGIGSARAIRLSVHGPGALETSGADVLFELEIGDCIPDADACFVRRAGSSAIWAIEGNLRELLLPHPDGGLPLIDPNVIPSVWPGARELPRRVLIEHAGREPIELTRHDLEPSDAGSEPEDASWRFRLRQGALEDLPLEQEVAALYATFLTRAPHAGLLDPRQEQDLDFDRPRARVELRPTVGPPLELRFADPMEHGIPIYNSFSGSVYLVDAELARLLAPLPPMLRSEEEALRWLEVLRREPLKAPSPGPF